MHFTIGDARYAVTISARPLFFEGRIVEAKLDRAGKRILISGELPRHERRLRLFHELVHIYADANARPASRDDETITQYSAETIDWAHDQYLQQGGDAVLEGLDPDFETTGRTSMPEAGPTRFECGSQGCGGFVMIGSVGDGEARYSSDFGAFVMQRSIHCDICGMTTIWWERCTPEGMPMGLIPHPKPVVVSHRATGHQEVCR